MTKGVDATDGARPLRVLLLGWHGSKERQLRPLARWYEARGHVARIVLTPTFRVMSDPGGWPRFGVELADAIAREHRADPRPLLVHAFSNTGFWTLSAWLDAAAARHPELLAAHLGSVIDSAPGFPERAPWWWSAKYAALAMTPSVLAGLGLTRQSQRPRIFHPLVTPPLMVLLTGWHFLASRQVAFMESGQRRVREPHRDKDLLFIYSGADVLIPADIVERFIESARRDDVRATALRFERSAHVRHFVEHRREYLDTVGRFVSSLTASS